MAVFRLMIFAIVLTGLAARASAESFAPIDTSQFGDGAHHWRKLRDEKRVIQPEKDQPAYAPNQVREIAANVLLFQRANGGWPKDYDMLAVLTDAQREQLAATRQRDDTSFDNHNTFSQTEYLARAYVATRDEAFRAGCEQGVDFLLAAQYPSGGFPQWHPRATGFHAHITFNDGAMMGTLRVLKDAADGTPHFVWLNQERRARCADAVARGVACILKCQIRVEGVLTGWCQQHDRDTFQPVSARTFELASICPQDTTEIVRFLMRIEPTRPEIVESVNAAVRWLESVKLTGTRVKRKRAPKEEFQRHTADFDVVVVSDPKADPLWARHYEIGTNRTIFAGRDGVKKYQLADIERERRTGTAWYGGWPRDLMEKGYPAWREKIGPVEAGE